MQKINLNKEWSDFMEPRGMRVGGGYTNSSADVFAMRSFKALYCKNELLINRYIEKKGVWKSNSGKDGGKEK